ncbi:MAG: YfbR-like 5'-deoxynucleotidase [Candidatus Hodarchaeota archaeon]
MSFFENIVLMKRLLRQGWVRAGIPLGSVESLADHSWATAVLTFVFSVQENQLRYSKQSMLDVGKGVLIALFHDFAESEYFDIDKSIENITDDKKFRTMSKMLEEGAIHRILTKFPSSESLEEILRENDSDEYHLVKIADLIDLLYQTYDYGEKQWLNKKQLNSFRQHALKQLQKYKDQFLFLDTFLKENSFLVNSLY